MMWNRLNTLGKVLLVSMTITGIIEIIILAPYLSYFKAKKELRGLFRK